MVNEKMKRQWSFFTEQELITLDQHTQKIGLRSRSQTIRQIVIKTIKRAGKT